MRLPFLSGSRISTPMFRVITSNAQMGRSPSNFQWPAPLQEQATEMPELLEEAIKTVASVALYGGCLLYY